MLTSWCFRRITEPTEKLQNGVNGIIKIGGSDGGGTLGGRYGEGGVEGIR